MKLRERRAAFWQRVCQFLKDMGAEESDGPYEWTLKTPIGNLEVSMWDADIYHRFADVEAGIEFTRQFTAQSGKWNWRFDDDPDSLNDDCEAQFVKYITRLMSLGTLPADLTTLTPDQTENCVARLSKLPLVELRRRQDRAYRQIELAFRERNDAALANLHVRAEHLRLAVDRNASGDGNDDRRRAGRKKPRT